MNDLTVGELIARYRKVFWAAEKQKVRRNGLSGDFVKDTEILIDRMNTKRRKNGFNTNWEGILWGEEVAV